MRISDWSSDVCSSDLDGTRWRWRSVVGSQLVRHYGFQQVPRLCDWGHIGRAICLSAWQDDQIPAEWRGLCSREWRWLHLGQIGSGTIYLYEPGRSEEHTYELQSLMRNSYAVFGL